MTETDSDPARVYSPAAWSIASLYSSVLASETRDLAGHIDAALGGARAEIANLRQEIERLRDDLKEIEAQSIATSVPNYVAVPARLLADAIMKHQITQAGGARSCEEKTT